MSFSTRNDSRQSTTSTFKSQTLPVIKIGQSFPPQIVGGIVFNEADGNVYVSNGLEWFPDQGAAINASYVVTTPTAAPPDSRIIGPGLGINLTDGGPGTTLTVSTVPLAQLTSHYLLTAPAPTLPNYSVLTAGTGITLTTSGGLTTLSLSSLPPPTNATYLVTALDGSLTADAVLTAGTGINISTSGGLTTVSKQASALNTSTYLLNSADLTNLPNSSTISAGTGITLSLLGTVFTLSLNGADSSQEYVLISPDTGPLPNSRTLTAGTNISISSVAGTTTINLSQPMNTNGDTLYYNSGLQRLGLGTVGDALRVVSGLPTWGDFIDLPNEIFIFDDFYTTGAPGVVVSGGADTGWTSSTAGGQYVGATSASNYTGICPGVLSFWATATGTGSAIYSKNVNTFTLGSYAIDIEFGLSLDTVGGNLPTSTNNYVFFAGIGDTSTGDSTNLVEMGFDMSGSTTNWIYRVGSTAAGITETATSFFVTPGQFYRFQISINAAGTSITFAINQVTVGTVTGSSIPASTAPMGCMIYYNRKTQSGSSNTCYGNIDYYYLYVRLPTARY